MDPLDVKRKLKEHICKVSGLSVLSGALHMSKIGYCPRSLYEGYGGRGRSPSVGAHERCWSGHRRHRDMLELLVGSGVCPPEVLDARWARQIAAPFDPRFVGHPDAWAVDGEWIEVKTMGQEEYECFRRGGQLRIPYLWQAQAYLRYGGRDVLLYMAVQRDPWAYWIVEMRRDDRVGEEIEQKARAVLAAVDGGHPPECVCGKCKP